MDTTTELMVTVRHPVLGLVPGAHVSVMRDGYMVASSTTDDHGTCHVLRDTDHQQTIRVEAEGLVTENRVIPIGVHNRNELFLLGLPGMSFYYQGRVRVPSSVPVTPRPRHLWGLSLVRTSFA